MQGANADNVGTQPTTQARQTADLTKLLINEFGMCANDCTELMSLLNDTTKSHLTQLFLNSKKCDLIHPLKHKVCTHNHNCSLVSLKISQSHETDFFHLLLLIHSF